MQLQQEQTGGQPCNAISIDAARRQGTRMNCNELSGTQLDIWVAQAMGLSTFPSKDGTTLLYDPGHGLPPRKWSPSHYWSQGGPIIEDHKIELNWEWEGNNEWTASLAPDVNAQGSSVLEAAMRAFVIAKIGPTVPNN